MFKLIISSITAATLIAGAVAFATTSAPAADALMITQGQDAKQTQTFAKGDRLRDPVKGSGCSVHGWPNFEPKCQFDLREPGREARNVRVIAFR